MADAIVLKGQPIHGDPEKKGWLFKWTNYLKGYQRRWFVLSNGLLSYYRNQAEMAHTCRGTISLLGALIHTADSCTFVISNGGTQTFHIRAHDEVERQSWVTALELAKAKAIRAQESDDDEDGMSDAVVIRSGVDGDCDDPTGVATELASRFHDLRTCSELVSRHGAALQRSLVDLEVPPNDTTKQISERATLFRISCNAMMNACSEFMIAAGAGSNRLTRALQHEREQKMRLQEVVEQLARQHDNLEKTVARSGHSGGNDTEDEDHEFFDAMEDGATTTEDNTFVMKVPVKNSAVKNGTDSDSGDETVTETKKLLILKDKERSGPSSTVMAGPDAAKSAPGSASSTKHQDKTVAQNVKVWPHASQVESQIDGHPRRVRVPDKPNYPLSLWSIMKNCIGKELSKIPIPVNFSEPLSMLQRLTEDYEYSSVLDQAAMFTDPAHQLAYVAAFTVSSYSTCSNRTNKPFNPLLGETFECDRMKDLGWRSISEQVSHHPPMLAQYCEGAAGWQCWQEFTMTTKFRGKYIQIVPLGSAAAMFPASGNKYTWRKVIHHPPTATMWVEAANGWKSSFELAWATVFSGTSIDVRPNALYKLIFPNGNVYRWGRVTTTVHNIIVGKLWVDNHGDMDIVGEAGEAAGYVAHLKYQPYGYFTKDTQRRVTGVIKDPNGVPRYVLQGYWDSRVEVAAVTSSSADNSVCKTGSFSLAWQRVPAPDYSDKMYNFTILAAQLNEPEPNVAPTDSRLRPDQRLMEQGLWDEANAEKLRLEDKQRTKRRQLEAETEEALAEGRTTAPAPKPLWFTRQVASPGEAQLRHMYNHTYWQCKEKQDWNQCPDIF